CGSPNREALRGPGGLERATKNPGPLRARALSTVPDLLARYFTWSRKPVGSNHHEHCSGSLLTASLSSRTERRCRSAPGFSGYRRKWWFDPDPSTAQFGIEAALLWLPLTASPMRRQSASCCGQRRLIRPRGPGWPTAKIRVW